MLTPQTDNFKPKSLLGWITAVCVVVVISGHLYPASSTEDFEVPVEEDLVLPTQTVTGQRGRGSRTNILALSRLGGGRIDTGSNWLTGDALVFSVACEKKPNSLACRLLACEVDPNSKECQYRLDTVIVTAERPRKDTKTYERAFQIDFTPFVFPPKFRTNKQIEEEREQKRKDLEKQCALALNEMFTDLDDFELGHTFESAVGGGISLLNGRARNMEAQEKILSQLVRMTQPIMTTGLHGSSPVEYLKGQEASTGIYLNLLNNRITRGSSIEKGGYNGTVRRNYVNDIQWKYTKEGKATKVTQKLVAEFHTHPLRIRGNTNIPWYAWPSVQDYGSHVQLKIENQIDRNAILAIGFIANNKYYLQLIQSTNDIGLKTIEYYVENPQKFGEFIKLLLNSSTKVAIIAENGKSIDYAKFFKENRSQMSAYGIKITPSSCDKI